jgi:hypothetical protein
MGRGIMEKEFFDLFNLHREIFWLNISYVRTCDWSLTVSDRRLEKDPEIFILSHQSPDRSLVFAKAYASLAEWYAEKFGGY